MPKERKAVHSLASLAPHLGLQAFEQQEQRPAGVLRPVLSLNAGWEVRCYVFTKRGAVATDHGKETAEIQTDCKTGGTL